MMHHEYSSYDYDHQYYASSSSVDCTLSLGTPSTRSDHQRSSYSSCWDSNSSPSVPHSHQRSGRRSGDDHLLARRCANCDTTSTPLWRNGPRGPKSLCNACGIRYKKEERRASAAASTGGAAAERHLYEQHVFNNTSWAHHQPHKMAGYEPATGTEYRFMDDVDTRDSFLSWRLNDFTR